MFVFHCRATIKVNKISRYFASRRSDLGLLNICSCNSKYPLRTNRSGREPNFILIAFTAQKDEGRVLLRSGLGIKDKL